MTTKYDWSDVMSNIKWLATDSDGNTWMYQSKPEIGGEDGDEWVGADNELVQHFGFRQYLGNWEDSLEQRPQGES